MLVKKSHKRRQLQKQKTGPRIRPQNEELSTAASRRRAIEDDDDEDELLAEKDYEDEMKVRHKVAGAHGCCTIWLGGDCELVWNGFHQAVTTKLEALCERPQR